MIGEYKMKLNLSTISDRSSIELRSQVRNSFTGDLFYHIIRIVEFEVEDLINWNIKDKVFDFLRKESLQTIWKF